MSIMSRTHKSKKREKPVTDHGQIAHERARRYMRNNRGVSYGDALSAVFRRDPKLFGAWRRLAHPWGQNEIEHLEYLSTFLNEAPEELREEPVSLVGPVIAWKDHPEAAVREAAQKLADKLTELQPKWSAAFVGKRPVLRLNSSRMSPYAIISRAILGNKLGFLRRCRCRDCQRFFATRDHRRAFCSRECFRRHEAQRVKLWRVNKET